MQKRHVTWAKWAAGFAFFAAADTALGTGAVRALAELCLTDGAPETPLPGMPMEHSGHAMPWLIAGGALASFAGFGSWTISQRAARGAWATRRRPILAGLAAVATAQGRISAAETASAWNTKLDPHITEDDAKIAMARFGNMSPDARAHLLAGLTDTSDRAALICMALRLLRERGDPSGAGLSMVEALASDMGMSGLEIASHWDASEAQSRAAVAVGEARALSAIATKAAIGRVLSTASRLEEPFRSAFGTVAPIARRAGKAALWGFIRALSSPRPARRDDQLAGLRQRFRRRGLSSRLQNLSVPQRAAFRRGFL